MPTKTSKTLAKQQQQHFKWYYVVILVALIAVTGILIIRLSNAGTQISRTWTGADSEWTSQVAFGRTTDNSLPAGNRTVLAMTDNIYPTSIKNDSVTLAYKQYIQACAYVKAPAGAEVHVDFLRGNGITPGKSINSGSQYGYTKYCSETKPTDSNSITDVYGYQVSTPGVVNGSYYVWKLERNILTSTK